MTKPFKIFMIIAIIFAVTIGLSYVIGYRPYVIISESMGIKYPKNSLAILDSRVRVDELKTGDVVGVIVGDRTVFHRIGSISDVVGGQESGRAGTGGERGVGAAGAAEKVIWLYGDSNGKDTGTEVVIDDSLLLGREALTIPGIGMVASMFVGRGWLVVVVGVVIIGLCCVPWERVIGRKRKASDAASE